MAGNDHLSQLSVYKQFFVEFAATVNPEDQLPVKVAGYYLSENELLGEIVDWILQYLSQKQCPSSLVTHLTKLVVGEIRQLIKKQPIACGYRDDNTYQPLKLMQVVTAKVNEVCLQFHNNDSIQTLPLPTSNLASSVCAIKNTRRRMEDRHTIIEDFHSVFNVNDTSSVTYYGIFDGHAGTDAAVYGVSHLHQFLAESTLYPANPVEALREAFLKTDKLFLDKSNRENLRSGTTALCALVNRTEKMMYVAWVGDSQAAIVRRGVAQQLVLPHKPDRDDERLRIEEMGGCVMFWGSWRVNGQLAVSRAIGDFEYKPYVSAEPDILAIPMEDDQDFLILGCDGLWDNVNEQEGVVSVYKTIREHPGDLDAVSQSLVQLSKQQGSVDNISVIVVFLTDPAKLAALDVWPSHETNPVTMDTNFDNNPFQTNGTPQTNGSEPSYQKASLLLDLDAGGEKYKQSAADSPTATDLYFLNRPAANGKEDTHYEDDDFGPETDVDAVDDVLLSPAIAAAKAAAAMASAGDVPHDMPDFAAMANVGDMPHHLAEFAADLEAQKQQLGNFDAEFAADFELQKQQLSNFDARPMEPRDETPTPPADLVADGDVVVPDLPEADNVAESGEESEDEWNYYKVEPTEKADKPAVEPEPQPVAEEEVVVEDDDDDDNMESRLNPNAAEFVPSPTSIMPSFEEHLLAGSPRKGGVSMDDIPTPSSVEFDHEVSMRPAELDSNDTFTMKDEVVYNPIPDFLNGHNELGDKADFGEFHEPLNPFKNVDHLFDKSEVSSTHAEYGDDTTTSFMTSMSDSSEHFQKVSDDLNASMVEADFQAANFFEEVNIASKNSIDFLDSDTVRGDQDKIIIPISQDLQNEILPSAQTKYEEMMINDEDLSEMNSTALNVQHDFQGDTIPPVFSPETDNLTDTFDPLEASFNPQVEEISPPLNLQLDPQAPEFSSQMSPVQVNSPLVSPSPAQGINTSVDMFADLATNDQVPSTMDLTSDVEPELRMQNDLLNELSEFKSEINVEAPIPDILQESSLVNGIKHLELDDAFDETAFNVQTTSVNVESTITHTQDSSLEEFASHVSHQNDFNDYLNGPSEDIVKDSMMIPSAPAVEAEMLEETVIEADVEKLPEIVSEPTTEIETVAAVAVTALAATAVVAATAVALEEKPNKDDTVQKTAVKKASAPDKTKPLAGTRVTPKAPSKSGPTKAPTSPPPMAAPRHSSTPKKPLAPTPTRVSSKLSATTASKVGSPAASNVTNRVKLGTPTAKPASASKLTVTKTTTSTTTTTTAARPRPATAIAPKLAADKKPALTNGTARPPIKRSEPLASKKLVPTTTSKPLARPASAPVAPKSATIPRTAISSTVTKTTPKPAGISKPKAATTTATSLTARAKLPTATSKAGLVDKQVKELANKQILQTVASKTSTVASKTSTVTRTATTTARRVAPGAATKTSTVKTTTTSSNKSGPIKRPAGTTVTKTTVTKTVDGQVEKDEVVVVEENGTTDIKDDSPIVDNAQPMVITSAD